MDSHSKIIGCFLLIFHIAVIIALLHLYGVETITGLTLTFYYLITKDE